MVKEEIMTISRKHRALLETAFLLSDLGVRITPQAVKTVKDALRKNLTTRKMHDKLIHGRRIVQFRGSGKVSGNQSARASLPGAAGKHKASPGKKQV
jgi:hypothetical protein